MASCWVLMGLSVGSIPYRDCLCKKENRKAEVLSSPAISMLLGQILGEALLHVWFSSQLKSTEGSGYIHTSVSNVSHDDLTAPISPTNIHNIYSLRSCKAIEWSVHLGCPINQFPSNPHVCWQNPHSLMVRPS